jgi:hypothetical protein
MTETWQINSHGRSRAAVLEGATSGAGSRPLAGKIGGLVTGFLSVAVLVTLAFAVDGTDRPAPGLRSAFQLISESSTRKLVSVGETDTAVRSGPHSQ